MYPAAAAFPSCRTSGAARYSGCMTIGKTRSALTVVLMLLFAAVGQGDDARAKNGAEGDLEDDKGRGEGGHPAATRRFPGGGRDDRVAGRLGFSVAPAQSYSGSSGMRIELFGRVGLPLLNVSAEDSIQLMGVPPPGAEGGGDSISASRLTSEFGWGVGARLMSGNWGIEGSYNIFESLDLTPSWLVADSNGVRQRKKPHCLASRWCHPRPDWSSGRPFGSFSLGAARSCPWGSAQGGSRRPIRERICCFPVRPFGGARSEDPCRDSTVLRSGSLLRPRIGHPWSMPARWESHSVSAESCFVPGLMWWCPEP